MGHLQLPESASAPYISGMTASTDPIRLAADFPAATREQWRELISAVLRKSGGRADIDPETALTTTTYDGIEIKALYTADDARESEGLPGTAPYVRGARAEAASWDVRQLHQDPDAKRANTAVLRDLASGATSLWLVVGERGIPVAGLGDVLDGVYLDLAPIALDAGADVEAASSALLGLATDEGALSGSLGADPVGTRARTGHELDVGVLGRLAQLAADAPGLRVATVDATVYHDAGAGDADELAIATSVGVAYLRALTDAGLSLGDALDRLEFRYAVTADQFTSIAKLRAARQLWSRVAELSGADLDIAGAQRQHAVTSAAMLTKRDPWVNMLRTTIGCFAAAVGGAEIITVLPFDSAVGIPDDFARRIARNTSAVLHDESSLSRVMDAGGGSWYVESLTSALAEKAWDTFTSLERAGGASAALESGAIGELVAATRERRSRDIATRRAPITGVSEFALISEKPLVRTAAPERSPGLLPMARWSDGFEQLRARADAEAVRPKIFLAALGPVAAHTARLSFASNLVQAGGLEAIVGTGDIDELAEQFRSSGTDIACLCGSDVTYDEQAAAVAQALGAKQLWLAGRAEVTGVDGHIYVGCDAIAALSSMLDAS
jgi:methylmalonyl-CoA mutase